MQFEILNLRLNINKKKHVTILRSIKFNKSEEL